MKMIILAVLAALTLSTAYAQDLPAGAATQNAGYQQDFDRQRGQDLRQRLGEWLSQIG